MKPIFIIGSPRSGTSIVAWSLAQHSLLWTSRESDILFNLFGDGHVDRAFRTSLFRAEGSWLHELHVEPAEFMGWIGFGVNALLTNRSEGRRWIDQTPVNTLLVDVLADMFPDGLFLHVLRDGRRVVDSMIHFGDDVGDEQKAALIQAGQLPVWSGNFTEACRTWRDFVEVSMDFCRRWPARSLTVLNESLVKDAEAQFEKMSRFLDVPYDGATTSFFQSNRMNSSFRRDSTDRRWAAHLSEPWREWSLDQRAVFVEEAGETLVKYGLGAADELHLGKELEPGTRGDSR